MEKSQFGYIKIPQRQLIRVDAGCWHKMMRKNIRCRLKMIRFYYNTMVPVVYRDEGALML